MSFVCAISGEIPVEPVISPVSGSLFEKQIIKKHLDLNGPTDPISGEKLSENDLIDLRLQETIKPKVGSANSIPGMLKCLQDEYDALCLNNFKLRKQLKASRQELSNFLYQNQASVEVIARLIKELKAARDAYDSLKPQIPDAKISKEELLSHSTSRKPNGDKNDPSRAQNQENLLLGLSDELKNEIEAKSKELSKLRSKRRKYPGSNFTSFDSIAKFSVQKTIPGIHSPSVPGIQSICQLSDRDKLLTAGNDGHVKIYSQERDKILVDYEAHTKPVTDLSLFGSDKNLAISSSKDGTISLMDIDTSQFDAEEAVTLKPQTILTATSGSPVVGLSADILSRNILSSSTSKWTFQDVEKQVTLIEGTEDPSGGEKAAQIDKFKYTSVRLHPDGLIFGLGLSTGQISIWSLKDNKHIWYFEGHKDQVQRIAFSENGYHLASISVDGTMKIWDLRKLLVVKSVEPPVSALRSLSFDPNSYLVGVGGSNSLAVYNTQSWDPILTLDDVHKGPINDLKFQQDGQGIFTAGQDRTVQIIN